MLDIATMIQHGATNLWIFIPTAIALGALHGLEPGHSKTMMAAFIVAVRGTVTQAVLLGLSATVSHTAIVWIIALAGLHYGSRWDMETTEPYFQVVSAILIIAIALWMVWRTWKHKHDHDKAHHHHGHGHSHGEESFTIDTGHGIIKLEVFEDGVPPRFRLKAATKGALNYSPAEVTLETERPDGAIQRFAFVVKKGFMESVEEIPEPHEFTATLKLSHGNHSHDYTVPFIEHSHTAPSDAAFEGLVSADYQDPHELAHANEIRNRFANQSITTGQIILFGLTGGLIPCPASITILLLCLQLKKITLGALLVLCFSIGLALTMVASGVIAALSVKHVSKRWSGFNALATKAPYFSGSVIIVIGLYIGYSGLKVLV